MLTRRKLLTSMACGLGMAALPAPAFASGSPMDRETRILRLYNTNTRELLTAPYVIDGQWEPRAIQALMWFMRDWRESQVTWIDPRLYDALYVIQEGFTRGGTLGVTSGHRTERTNAKLHEVIPRRCEEFLPHQRTSYRLLGS